MSFATRPPKRDDAPAVPNPTDTQGSATSARRRRMASGGTQSTFMGSWASAALPSAGATLTGLPR